MWCVFPRTRAGWVETGERTFAGLFFCPVQIPRSGSIPGTTSSMAMNDVSDREIDTVVDEIGRIDPVVVVIDHQISGLDCVA